MTDQKTTRSVVTRAGQCVLACAGIAAFAWLSLDGIEHDGGLLAALAVSGAVAIGCGVWLVRDIWADMKGGKS